MRFCAQCTLPERFPGAALDAAGVCAQCRRHAAPQAAEAERARLRARFAALVAEVRGAAPRYDCVLAFSGGKDSTYTLELLRRHYALRVLAVTVDNGFLSAETPGNIRRTTAALGAKCRIVAPDAALLRRVFAGVARAQPYPPKALERATDICNACMGLVKSAVLRIAIEQRAPLVAYGWSPGQAPIGAAIARPGHALVAQMEAARTAPLRAVAGRALDDVLALPAQLAEAGGLPWQVSPLAFHPYDEAAVRSAIARYGWRAPKDTDGNSTNCLLNAFAVRRHLAGHGFHPYAAEVAELVRCGACTRDEGFRSLRDLGSDAEALRGAQALGLDPAPPAALLAGAAAP